MWQAQQFEYACTSKAIQAFADHSQLINEIEQKMTKHTAPVKGVEKMCVDSYTSTPCRLRE